MGIWGQYIYVHPTYDIGIAKTSTDYDFDLREKETIAVFRSLAREMGRQESVEVIGSANLSDLTGEFTVSGQIIF